MANEKKFKVRIEGDASQLVNETRKAASALNALPNNGLLRSVTNQQQPDRNSFGAGVNHFDSFASNVLGFQVGTISGAATAAVGAVISSLVDLVRDTRQLVMDARNLGVNRGDLAVINRAYAAKSSDPTSSATHLAALRIAQGKALAGRPDFIEAFANEGVSASGSLDDVYKQLVKSYSQGAMNDQRMAGAHTIFGEAARSIVEMSANGLAEQIEVEAVRQKRGMLGTLGYAMIAGAIPQWADTAFRLGTFKPAVSVQPGDPELYARSEMMGLQNNQSREALRLQRMTASDRLMALTEKKMVLRRSLDTDNLNPVQRAQAEADIIGLEGQIFDLQRSQSRGPRLTGRPMDALASAGLFAGRGSQNAFRIPEEQLKELRDLNQRVADQTAVISERL